MRKTVVKRIRRLVNPQTPAARRVYRRMKKAYASLPHNKKGQFLKVLELGFSKQD